MKQLLVFQHMPREPMLEQISAEALDSSRARSPMMVTHILSFMAFQLTVLYEISQLLVSIPDPKEALGPVLDILHSKMGTKRGTITLLDPVTQKLDIKAAHGLTNREWDTQRGSTLQRGDFF